MNPNKRLNEQIKLLASAIMLLGNTAVTLGILGPLAAWAFNQGGMRAAVTGVELWGGAACFFLLFVALHIVAQFVLVLLQPE